MTKALWTALLLIHALALAGSSAAQLPLENWTHRGGPNHWLGIAPIESHIERNRGDVVRCTRGSARCASTPVFLMDCKAPHSGADSIPVGGSLHFNALPGDPHALQVLDPFAWIWSWKTQPYHESRVEVTLDNSLRPPVRFPATVTRKRWAYSTNTAYEVTPLPIRAIAEALARAGKAKLSIEGPEIRVHATFALNGRTGEFLNACDRGWKNPPPRR